jgi:hypothetical protein
LTGPIAGAPEIAPRIFVARDGAEPVRIDGPTLRVMDPSDVESISENLVARQYPQPGSTNGPPNEFAYVELRRPDLPWMFTPAAAANGRLRPWIVLVVVPLSFDLVDARPLSRLRVPTAELPDLNDSWAWAHAQVIADSPADIEAAIARGGAGAVSRLVCPRKLDELTWYRACVVPAFTPELRPSWEGDAGTTEVPIYLWWDFRTGEPEGFEELVKRLHSADAASLAQLGTRTVDASRPWPTGKPLRELAGEADVATPVTFQQDGALAVPNQESRPSMDDAARDALVSQLTEQLNHGVTDGEPGPGAEPGERSERTTTLHLTPPIYGRYYPGVDRVDPSKTRWTDDLNLDPRRRVAAAMGTRYVQKHQEFLMARSWEQLQDLELANRLRRLAELASVAGDALHRRHVAALTPSEMLTVAAPARTRLVQGERTLEATVHESPLPDGAATPAFTRLVKRKGPLGRRLSSNSASAMIERTLVGELRPRVETTTAPIVSLGLAFHAGATDVTTRRAAPYRELVVRGEKQALASALATVHVAVTAAEAEASFPAALEPVRTTIRETLAEWDVAAGAVDSLRTLFETPQAVKAATDAIRVMSDFVATREPMAPVRPQIEQAGMDLGVLSTSLASSLRPSLSLQRRLKDRMTIPFGEPAAAFGQVMAHPTFPAPLALAALHDWPDIVLPGLGTFPLNKVTLLETNPAFIEAFLVGANHEMNRELLWREFPTDQRGTPFTHFWPRVSTDRDDGREIDPIAAWRLERRLGKNLPGGRVEETVLLVRGEVLRRFPNTIVMAAPALDGRTAADLSQWRLPEFAMPLGNDSVAYVFNLRTSNQSFDPGRWFFIFQEPVSIPRFGLDVSRLPGDDILSWNDVSWGDVTHTARPQFLDTHAVLPTPANPAGATWDENRVTAADVAAVTVQRPFQIRFHGRALLG